ncbi:hypothetical protein I4F81_005781 [Pyropia yezoensis]|uniref:Uncharacterized protein n=1 Tax=Pyropia yezoensis TaxID=2788 RepID=A0ACC3BZ41_PYRYE|nr:hypothetical protein I4F81_005781 [Neopyropia yezoensis]
MGTFMRRLLRSSKKTTGGAAAEEPHGASSSGGGYAEEEPRSEARQSRDDAGRGGHGADEGARGAPRSSRHHPSRRTESDVVEGSTASRRAAAGPPERDASAPVPGVGDAHGRDGSRHTREGGVQPGIPPSAAHAAGSSDAGASQDSVEPRRRRSKRHSRGQSRDMRDMPAEGATADAGAQPPVWAPATVAAMAAAEMPISTAGADGSGAPGVTALPAAVPPPPGRPPPRPSAPTLATPAPRTPHERSAKIASDGLEGVWLVEPAALLLPISLGACSKAGWEPVRDGNRREVVEVRKENQDAFCAHGPFSDHGGQIMVGVFDGHGAEGRGVSHFVRDTVPRAARELYSLTAPGRGAGDDPELALTTLGPIHEGYSHSHGTARRAEGRRADVHRARAKTLKAAFLRTERALTADGSAVDHVFSGTTAVVVWLHGADLYSACAGDSRAIIGRRLPPASGADGGAAGQAERFHSVDTTWDQKPSRTDERKRVKSAGGRVARWRRNVGPLRVWKPTEWLPGLAMTRSIGDTVLSPYGVQPVPEVSYIRLCQRPLLVNEDGKLVSFPVKNDVVTNE